MGALGREGGVDGGIFVRWELMNLLIDMLHFNPQMVSNVLRENLLADLHKRVEDDLVMLSGNNVSGTSRRESRDFL